MAGDIFEVSFFDYCTIVFPATGNCQYCGSGFFFSFSDLDPTFLIVSDPDPVSDPTWIFSNVFNLNFTFCKRAKTGHFLWKNEFILFKLSILLRNCQITSELPGSGMICSGSGSSSGSC